MMQIDFQKIFNVNKHDDDDASARHLQELAAKRRKLRHALHDKIGAALGMGPLNKQQEQPMTWEALEKFVKNNDGYMLSFCKSITDIGNKTDLTEAEFTKLATAAAQRDYPNDRPDKAFAKYFDANPIVRRAYAVVKGLALVMPVYVGGDAALAVDDPADALAQLQELAAEQHRRQPETSLDKAFAKVYTDPANARLAQAERRQNRPRAVAG
jgi:hypothetical protein